MKLKYGIYGEGMKLVKEIKLEPALIYYANRAGNTEAVRLLKKMYKRLKV